MPSRTHLAAVAVTSTSVRPSRTVTAPSAWRASRPVSRVISLSEVSLPLMVTLTLMVSAIVRLLPEAGPAGLVRGGRVGQFPGLAGRADGDGRPGGGSWQLTLPSSVFVLWSWMGLNRPGQSRPGRRTGGPWAARGWSYRRKPSLAMIARYRSTSLRRT